MDEMNVQLDSENLLTDGLSALKSIFVQEEPKANQEKPVE